MSSGARNDFVERMPPLPFTYPWPGKGPKEIMRGLKRYVARDIYNQLFHQSPAPDGGTLRTTRTAKLLTLQQAADAPHTWPTTLSRLDSGLNHDNELHKRYETGSPANPRQSPKCQNVCRPACCRRARERKGTGVKDGRRRSRSNQINDP